MHEYLRSFNVGVVNLMGIMVPGLLFILFGTFVLIIPSIIFLHSLMSTDVSSILSLLDKDKVIAIYQTFKWEIIVALLVFSYACGYLLRLLTPDRLDRKSAERILKDRYYDRIRSDRQKSTDPFIKKWKIYYLDRNFKKWAITFMDEDNWCFKVDDEADRFPYLQLKKYLQARGLNDVAELAIWNPNSNSNTNTKSGSNIKDSRKEENNSKIQRSKIIINAYKLEVRRSNPEFTAFLDSHEAHIRLMNGIWQIAKFWWGWSLSIAMMLFVLFFEKISTVVATNINFLFALPIIYFFTACVLLYVKRWI